MNAPLLAVAEEEPHDPFNAEGIGPYRRGAPLGITLGEWLRQTGTGSYTCDSGRGQLDLEFKNLIPRGVYTMWHAFIAIPPPVPFTGTLDIPLGARDGSESVFVADR